MLQDNGRQVKQERNYHITTEELAILFKYARRFGTKYQLMLLIGAFRGLRISEICAINILDFANSNFDKLTYREAKTNKLNHNKPIIPELATMIKTYVITNRHLLTDGYLFPYYASRRKAPHMTVGVASSWFGKLRRIIGRDHPSFLDRYNIVLENGRVQVRYRIGWHSLRRWFETNVHSKTDIHTIQRIMNYSKMDTLNHYLSKYEVLKREPLVLENALSPVFTSFIQLDKNQTKLRYFND